MSFDAETNVDQYINKLPSEVNSKAEDMARKRRRELFGDCRLIEIIHLHDCLRGALTALRKDMDSLAKGVLSGDQDGEVPTLERRVAGRFKVIWSVFRAHSCWYSVLRVYRLCQIL